MCIRDSWKRLPDNLQEWEDDGAETPGLSLSGEQGEIFERRLRSYERLSKIVLNLISQSLA